MNGECYSSCASQSAQKISLKLTDAPVSSSNELSLPLTYVDYALHESSQGVGDILLEAGHVSHPSHEGLHHFTFIQCQGVCRNLEHQRQ